MPKPPDWWVLLLFLPVCQASPIKRQVSLDDLIYSALNIVRPIFDTSRPIQESPAIIRKSNAESVHREVSVLGAPHMESLDVPICQGNSNICKFISCTAHNFKYDENFANLNLAAQMLADKNMRQVVSRNPEAVTSICREQGLSEGQCKIFANGFQLIDKFMNTIERAPSTTEGADPLWAPLNDEPEPARSAASASAPSGSHTWSARKPPPLVRHQLITHSTANRTPPLGLTLATSTARTGVPRAKSPALAKPAPLPMPRPMASNDFEDDPDQKPLARPRRETAADYYDVVSAETVDQALPTTAPRASHRHNCMYLLD